MLTAAFSTIAVSLNLAGGSWLAINDDVMGGKSRGGILRTDEGFRFEGDLSLANNGGFSSVRRALQAAPVGAERVYLYLKGDKRRYQLRLRHDDRRDGISWAADFDTSGEWQAIELDLSSFKPVFRGRTVLNAGPVRADSISQVGLLIADKRSGPFRLDVRHLEFISTQSETN
jgi:monofunctional biosynthetic peptidoglycan transglycosylase